MKKSASTLGMSSSLVKNYIAPEYVDPSFPIENIKIYDQNLDENQYKYLDDHILNVIKQKGNLRNCKLSSHTLEEVLQEKSLAVRMKFF